MKNKNEDTSMDTRRYNKRLMGNVVRMPMEIGCCIGSRMVDNEGQKSLFDYWGDEGVCSLGYNTPEVLKAIGAFLHSGHPHQLPDIYPNEKRWEAAEIICNRTGMHRIFFANSGTEANEAAIKLARKHWYDLGHSQRYKVMTVEGNFHGRTGLSLAAGDYRVSPYHKIGFGPIAQGFGVIKPVGVKGKDRVGLDMDWERIAFKQVVEDGVTFGEYRNPDWDSVAAIILAPVLGNNLVMTYPQAFWKELERIRKEHNVLLIYDDVQAGSGRAGHYATWQHPDIQVKPDIMTLAKGIAMGFPMSCMLSTEVMAESFTPGVHFNTFGGSPFVCHMATEMYKWLDENLEWVRSKGEFIRGEFKKFDWVDNVDGSGMLNAFTPKFEEYGYDGFQLMHKVREYGLSIATHRKFGPIRFTPALNVSRAEISIAIDWIFQAHTALAKK